MQTPEGLRDFGVQRRQPIIVFVNKGAGLEEGLAARQTNKDQQGEQAVDKPR